MRLTEMGYRLVVKGGCYQEVPQLHFHSIGGMPDAVDEGGS
jgi:diadenosine tetraphosphate (Ap4A) HIT family hydrolase